MSKKKVEKVAVKGDKASKEVKRLTDKEFKELERAVHTDNYEFEHMMCGVLNRRAWADLIKDAMKHKGKALTKEQKTKLEQIVKSYIDVCEDDVIELTLEHFSGDVRRRRCTLAVERSLRKKEKNEEMSPEEKLLAEVFAE